MKFLSFMTAPDDGAGSGQGAAGDGSAGTDGAEDKGAGGGTGDDKGAGTGGDAGTDKVTFSAEQQAKVDQLIQDRLARQKTADAEIVAKAQKWDTQEAGKSGGTGTPANDKPATDADINKAVQDAVNKALLDQSAKTSAGFIRAEIKAQAAALGFHNPATAAVLLGADAAVDLSKITVTDGEVDAAAVLALVKTLAESSPYLIKTTGPGALPGVGSGGGAPDATTTANPGKDRIKAAYASSAKS